MSRKRKSMTPVLISLGAAALLSACQAGTAEEPRTQEQAAQEQTSAPQAPGESDTSEQLQVYAGPGTDYLLLGTIDRDAIQNAVKIESNWVEIETDGKRGYVPQKDVEDLCTKDTPRVIDYTVGQDLPSYPFVIRIGTDITLFDEAGLYMQPSAGSPDRVLAAGETVTIQSIDMSPIQTCAQIEIGQGSEKERCYVGLTDLLSMDNPLLNLERAKETNAAIAYDGGTYCSSSGEIAGTPDGKLTGWDIKKELTITEAGWGSPAQITDIVKSWHVNNDSLDGKFRLFRYEDRQHLNAAVKKDVPSNISPVIEALYNGSLPLAQGPEDTLTLKIELQSCQGEDKIVIKAGAPIETLFEEEKVSLDTLIMENMALTAEEAVQKEDDLIKQAYPILDEGKDYSMEMTFSKELDEEDMGYYLVIDKEQHVYALPLLLHDATTLNIYSEDGTWAFDATFDLAATLMQIDDESAARIIDLLAENGFVIQ